MKRWLFLCAVTALLSCVAHGTAAAQDPPRPRPPVPDTLAADTLPRDTAAAPAAQDSALPPPRFSAIFGPAAGGAGRTLFYWDREALLREAAVTLADLLEQVPGMIALRAGIYQQPEAVTAFGQTRGRIEVVLDGYVLDPLTAATVDIAEIEIAQLDELRVERRLDLTRIHITTLEPTTAQPYSRIEAATGEPNGSVFRAVFSAPHVIAGPLALAVDRIDSDGIGGNQDADLFAIWGKWGWFNATGSRALQVEFRQNRLRRLENVPWVADIGRRDLILRARNRFLEGVSGEVFVGRTSQEVAPPDTANADSVATLERGHWQFGLRAAVRRSPAWLDAEFRFRDSDALPSTQLDVNGGVDVGRFVRLAGSFSSAAWSAGEGASSYDVRAEVEPFAGFGAFAELAGGTRGAPVYADSAGRSTLEDHSLSERSGTRLGLFTRLFGSDVSAALVTMEADSSRSFGLPFEPEFTPYFIEDASGLEVFGRVPLWPRGLAATGSFTYWDKATGWLYLPSRNWRVAAELHTLPLASRNLEILGRLEHQRREAMLIPNPDYDPEIEESSRFRSMPPRDLLNGYLHIRIIDVRAFIHWYDLLGKFREDIPGQVIRGPRILYGVKWQLFN